MTGNNWLTGHPLNAGLSLTRARRQTPWGADRVHVHMYLRGRVPFSLDLVMLPWVFDNIFENPVWIFAHNLLVAKNALKIIMWPDRLPEESRFGPVQHSPGKFGLTPVVSSSPFLRHSCPSSSSPFTPEFTTLPPRF